MYEQIPSTDMEASHGGAVRAPDSVRCVRVLVAAIAATISSLLGVLLSVKLSGWVNPYVTGVLAIAMFCTGLLRAARADCLLDWVNGAEPIAPTTWIAFASTVFGATLFLCLTASQV